MSLLSPALFPDITRDDVFVLGTRRLWLRWPQPADATILARIGGDARVANRTGTWPVGADVAFALDKIEAQRARNAAGTGFGFVIAPREAWAEPIGMIGFNVRTDARDNPGGPAVTGGYHLAPEHWGQGYASEALRAILDMIQLLTPVVLVQASVMPDNPASAKVLTKAGFVRVCAGLLTTEPRGTFPVEHFERVLRARPTTASAAFTQLYPPNLRPLEARAS